MYFVEDLLSSQGKTVIMIVMDHFIECGYFIGLSHPYSTHLVAQVLLDFVYKFHGFLIPLLLTVIPFLLVGFGENHSSLSEWACNYLENNLRCMTGRPALAMDEMVVINKVLAQYHFS